MTPLVKFNRAVFMRRDIGAARYNKPWPPSDLTIKTLPLETIQELIDGVGNYLYLLWQKETGWRKWVVGALYYAGRGIALALLYMYEMQLDDIVNHSRKVER